VTGSCPRFPLLAEVDFPLDCFQQELLSGNLGVMVKVVADAFGEAVAWEHAGRLARQHRVLQIEREHKHLSLVKWLDSPTFSERTNPASWYTLQSNSHAKEVNEASVAVAEEKNRNNTDANRLYKPGTTDRQTQQPAILW
jgi:hypothetical protein